MHENEMHARSCFLTLTYNKKHLPPEKSLNVAHWQLFAKKVRAKLGPFRFYHCGEYGEKNKRPHYHCIMYGHNFAHDRVHHSFTESKHELFTSPTLDKLWGKGFAYIGNVTFDSAAYVARYIMKKITGEAAFQHYLIELDENTGEYTSRTREYATMSLKPGLGRSWIEKYVDQVYQDDQVVINGKTAQPPKYYDSYLEGHNEKQFQKIKAARSVEAAKHEANNTPDRLIVREKVQRAKDNLTPRHI